MKSHTNPSKLFINIVVTLMLITSCSNQNIENPELDTYKKKIEQQDNLIKKLTNQINESHTEKPTNLITSSFAKEIYHLYDKREDIINEYIGTDGEDQKFNATRSLFYDFNRLKNYLQYVEKQSKKAHITPSGFKFYFAQYPEKYKRGKEKRYAKRQTIFIAPTVRKKIDGTMIDLGYTLDSDYNVVFLKDKLNFDNKTDNEDRYQKAGLFNVSFDENIENSLLVNEMGSSPPIGKIIY